MSKPTLREKVEACFRHAKEGFALLAHECGNALDHDPDELDEITDMIEVARVLQFVSERMADPSLSPGPFAVARALRMATDYGELERAVQGGGKVYPPSREAMMHGFREIIAERNRQLEGLREDFERLCPGERIDSHQSGIATAYRKVLRERDALVAARDCA